MRGRLRSIVGFVVIAVAAVALVGCSTEPTATQTESTPTTTEAPSTSTATTKPEEAPHVDVGPGVGTGSKPCGSGVRGNETASCPFAWSVRRTFFATYDSTHIPPAHVTAYSPVTHKTYELNCNIIATGDAQCTTKTGATVSFPVERATEAKPEPEEAKPETSSEEGEDKVGSSGHAGDAKFCSEHTCIGKFTEEEGTVVECEDGTYSHAGGLSGACSHHGGEK